MLALMTRTLSMLVVTLALLAAGCTSTQITNLTPSRQARNPDNLYVFEVDWHSNQQSIRKESIQPYVVIGEKAFPMQRTPMIKNRWETLVPLPAGESLVNYHYKFDYDYNSIPVRRSDSKRSQPFQLRVDPR